MIGIATRKSQRNSLLIASISQISVRRIQGRATAEATKAYHDQFKNSKDRCSIIPKTGCFASKLGFGGYRLSESVPEHGDALERALCSGINVFDTANHFAHGQSERLFKKVMHKLVESGRLRREDFIVISKAGFLLSNDSQKKQVFPRAVKLSPSVSHCISPIFLESQITESLDRLGLETVDIFMINCPERLLLAKNISLHKSQVYDMLAESFEYLEREVARGRIAGYGLASNSLVTSKNNSSDALVFHELMRAVSKETSLEHLVAIEFPLNLYELDSLDPAYGDGENSLIEQIQEMNLFPITQRPLYAIRDGNVRLLSSLQGKEFDLPELHTRITTLFEKLNNLESDYITFSKQLFAHDSALVEPFIWSHILTEDLPKLSENYLTTSHYFDSRIKPPLQKRVKAIRQHAPVLETHESRDRVLVWADEYEATLFQFMDAITDLALSVLVEQNKELNGILSSLSRNALSSEDTLSKNLFRVYTSLSASSPHTTLVGMRKTEYVQEAIDVLDEPQRLDEDTVQHILQAQL